MGWKERFSRLPRKVGSLYSATESLADSSEPLPPPEGVAQEIDPAFAMEILLFSWEDTLRETEGYRPYFRPAIKRSIIALHSAAPGRSRSIHKLALLVASCATAMQEDLEAHSASWTPGPTKRTILLQITGETLQTTKFSRDLVRDIQTSLSFTARRVKGDHDARHPSDEVMAIARNTSNLEGIEDFWMGIYVRLALFIRLTKEATNTSAELTESFMMLPRGTYIQTTFGDDLDQHLDIYADDLTKHVSYRGTDRADDLDLVTHPFLEVPQGFISSGRLVLDSIAPFALRCIHESGGWRDAISAPFEARVISALRAHGSIAGTVSERAHWSAGRPTSALGRAMLDAADDCPGEIDVVSFDGYTLQIFECKSVYPFLKFRNLVGRISDEDVSGWISNAETKGRWLEEATGIEVSFVSIVVEGVEYWDLSEHDRPVYVIDFKTFSTILDEATRS